MATPFDVQDQPWALQGLLANRPPANSTGLEPGYRYFATDLGVEYMLGGSPLAWNVVGAPGLNIQTPAIVAGLYNLANGTEFVRVAPDGSLVPIVIVLPNPALYVCDTVLVKKMNGEFATDISVTSAANIDGAGADVWPHVGYFARRYTSDGITWCST